MIVHNNECEDDLSDTYIYNYNLGFLIWSQLKSPVEQHICAVEIYLVI